MTTEPIADRARQVPSGLMTGLFLVMLVAANISIAVSQLSLGLALCVLLARWARGARPATIRLEWPALLLAGWALLTVPFSADPGQSVIFFRRFFLFSVMWIAATTARDDRTRLRALIALVLGALLISLYGQIRAVVLNGGLFNLRVGEMSNPMTSGALLMMVLLVLAGQILVPGQGRRLRIALLLASLPILLALVQTMTRSAWLGMIAGLLVVVVLARPSRRLLGVIVIVALLAMVPVLRDGIIPERLAARFQLSYILGGRSTTERLEMWRGGMIMVRHNPIVGVGDCDLTEVAPLYYGGPDTDYYGHLHSNPVMFAVIWGVPGFVLAMGFLVVQLIRLLQRWRRLAPLQERAPPQTAWPLDRLAAGWVLGAVGVWVGFFVAGLTEWYFGDAESLLLYLAVVGVALAPVGLTAKDNASGETHA